MSTVTKDQIKEAIKSMTILEISELVKDLEAEFGVSASSPMMMSGLAVQGQGPSLDDQQQNNSQTEFNVVLKSAGSSKIPLIKEIRTITNLGLKEAKTLVDSGGVIKGKLPKEEAEKIKKVLVDLGATIDLE